MSAYTKATNLNAPELVLAAVEAAAERFNTATEHLTAATKAILMLAGAPLLGLAFVIGLPIISVALTVYYGTKLIAARWTRVARHLKNVALFFAAPFIGLAYIIALPFVGVGTLVYFGVKAVRK